MVLTNPLSASEVGTLWLTYQEKTMILRILEYFNEKADDQRAKNITGGLWESLNSYVLEMEKIFQDQGIAKPIGFTKEDVNLEAPKLYDNGFDVMFVRVLKEVSMGMYTMNMNMAYNNQMIKLYEGLTSTTQRVYLLSTQYLLEKGILSLPPKTTMPKTVEFIKSKKYQSGFNLFAEKRALNDLELGILHHGIESNNVGLQLITGFAQCAKTPEVKAHFVKGMELCKKQIKMFEEILLDSNVHFSATSGSTVTTSTVPPFSEKLMMHCIFILNGFSITGNAFGTFFTFRNDIIMKIALIAKDIFFYGQEGIEIKIKHGWFEEPPQMEDRAQIINNNQ
ncbi:DUF3231 family protein [Bacillus sp. 1P10SD]|uniref:DUF3231 family protein n=1 Tax=Bacillus sp. 1P10SD TaxID=3132265 RepID=UPI0039A6A920